MSIIKKRLIKAKFSKTPKELFKDLFWDSIKKDFNSEIHAIDEYNNDVMDYINSIYQREIKRELPQAVQHIKNAIKINKEKFEEELQLDKDSVINIIMGHDKLAYYKFDNLIKTNEKHNILKMIKREWDKELYEIFTNPDFEYNLEEEEESPMMETEEFHKYISDMKKGAEELLDEYIKEKEETIFRNLKRLYDQYSADDCGYELGEQTYEQLKKEGLVE